MTDYIDVLARVAQATVESEYYGAAKPGKNLYLSLKEAISLCKRTPVISEIKVASPSAGTIRQNVNASEIAKAMERGGAVALSVITEPKQFGGSLEALSKARQATKIPMLMKDIVISPAQVYAARKMGADAILLIQALFDRGYCDRCLSEMIAGAHSLGLEVLLETHTETEFREAVQTEADLVGINNRDLRTLKTNLNVTKQILEKNDSAGKIVVSESGIKKQDDIRFLRDSGARAFLIGSAVMSAADIEKKVEEFVKTE